MRLAALFVACLCFSESLAATLNTDGSASDTQSKINSASTGDIVLLPATGSYTWSSAVSIPNTKGITLDGNGRTITCSGGVTLNPMAKAGGTASIIRNFIFSFSGSGSLDIEDSATTAWFRVCSNDFRGSGTIINMQGQGGDGGGGGVWDHNTITNIAVAQETMHIWGWGDGVTTGWTTTANLNGHSNLMYFEDNTFKGAAGNSSCCFQGYYGERICARYNSVTGAMFEQHGTAGNIGCRWWEFYENKLTNMTMCIRAGSGVIFNNTANNSDACIGEEDSGYPADYQPGRGINQALDPIYYWGNSASFAVDLNPAACCAPDVANMVQLNRDIYAATKSGYTAFTYPHPLVSGNSGGSTLASSASLGTGTLRVSNGKVILSQ